MLRSHRAARGSTANNPGVAPDAAAAAAAAAAAVWALVAQRRAMGRSRVQRRRGSRSSALRSSSVSSVAASALLNVVAPAWTAMAMHGSFLEILNFFVNPPD